MIEETARFSHNNLGQPSKILNPSSNPLSGGFSGPGNFVEPKSPSPNGGAKPRKVNHESRNDRRTRRFHDSELRGTISNFLSQEIDGDRITRHSGVSERLAALLGDPVIWVALKRSSSRLTHGKLSLEPNLLKDLSKP